MLFRRYVGVLVASSSLLVSALPSTDSSNVNTDLRLIKTSEIDPGTWVTEEEKVEKYVAKNINFVDVTDITVPSPILNNTLSIKLRYLGQRSSRFALG